MLASHERETRFGATLRRFLRARGLLDRGTRALLVEEDLSDARLEAFLHEASEVHARGGWGGRGRAGRLAALVPGGVRRGAPHALPPPAGLLRAHAAVGLPAGGAARGGVRPGGVTEGFRHWLGPTIRVAVDPDTGREYRWDDVVVFEEGIAADHRRRILAAVKETVPARGLLPLLRADPAPERHPSAGVWVRPWSERSSAAVYRLTVQTRLQGAFDLTAAVNLGLTREEVVDELHWLVLCGEPGDREPLVADVGGYWEGPDLWSEELLPGETLERALRRQERAEGTDRLKLLWPFVSMRALTAYVDVWNRTGRRWEVADLGPANVIVPTHDYQTGARVVAWRAWPTPVWPPCSPVCMRRSCSRWRRPGRCCAAWRTATRSSPRSWRRWARRRDCGCCGRAASPRWSRTRPRSIAAATCPRACSSRPSATAAGRS